jgi:hypothetical protein
MARMECLILRGHLHIEGLETTLVMKAISINSYLKS